MGRNGNAAAHDSPGNLFARKATGRSQPPVLASRLCESIAAKRMPCVRIFRRHQGSALVTLRGLRISDTSAGQAIVHLGNGTNVVTLIQSALFGQITPAIILLFWEDAS